MLLTLAYVVEHIMIELAFWHIYDYTGYAQ